MDTMECLDKVKQEQYLDIEKYKCLSIKHPLIIERFYHQEDLLLTNHYNHELKINNQIIKQKY